MSTGGWRGMNAIRCSFFALRQSFSPRRTRRARREFNSCFRLALSFVVVGNRLRHWFSDLTLFVAFLSSGVRPLLPLPNLLQPRLDAFLDALFRGVVVRAVFEVVGQTLHVRYFLFEVWGAM